MFSVLRYHNLLMIANLNSVPAVSMKHISTDTWKNVHHKIVHVHVLYFYIIYCIIYLKNAHIFLFFN